MRIFTHLLIILSIAVIFSSCEKKFFKPPVVDPNVPITFTGDIQPLLTSKCAVSGCHSGAVSPNLVLGQAYANLMDGGLLDTLKPAESVLMVKLNTNMPPQKLPASDINKVLTWITQGAKEN